MTLQTPRLDDRNFDQLLAEALRLVQQKGIDWTDLSPSDPGIVLLELFAHLTEVMLYRLNRLPEKAYVEFLRLLGVTIQPPAAAGVELLFSRSRATKNPLEIPRGTRVTVQRTVAGQEPPVFMTIETVEIPANEKEITARAYHCEQVEAELVGQGSSLPGQSVVVAHPPIIAPTGDPLDLIVAVEASQEEAADERIPAITHAGKTFRVWQAVEYFSEVEDDPHVYVVDRAAGRITFAPAVNSFQPGADDALELLAEVPQAGRDIRVWYRYGGGPDSNVAAEQLITLKDQIPGLRVTNPARATGGKAAETLENALVRGPEELHSLNRAVTARDFERIAINASSRTVARAKAFTRADLWAHALPGHVEVLLVPDIGDQESISAAGGAPVSAEFLEAHETPVVRDQIQRALDESRPLGTDCVVNWARYKAVQVHVRAVVQREEDPNAVRERIENRLRQTLTPVPTMINTTGWRFGQALRASHVYDIALSEPGVRWVDPPRLVVDEVPAGHIHAIAIDHFQAQTWFVGSDTVLFRSLNNGTGWESVGQFGGPIAAVETHPQRPGLVAVAAARAEGTGSEVRISNDCGETWDFASFPAAFAVRNLSWMIRNEEVVLLMATDVGLYEYVLRDGSTPIQLLVDPQDQDLGFYEVVTHTDLQGVSSVAVTAENVRGVFLSTAGGRSNSFRHIGQNIPDNEDLRVLKIQFDGPRAFLWAGAYVTGPTAGNGCYRWELRGTQDPPEGWVSFKSGWAAGSCHGLAFHGSTAYAASHRLGVLILDNSRGNATWQPPEINCGLPLRERETERLFQPVDAVACSLSGTRPMVMVGGIDGLYSSLDQGVRYQSSSSQEFVEKVTLPPTWLFVSGEHQIAVVSEDEAE